MIGLLCFVGNIWPCSYCIPLPRWSV